MTDTVQYVATNEAVLISGRDGHFCKAVALGCTHVVNHEFLGLRIDFSERSGFQKCCPGVLGHARIERNCTVSVRFECPVDDVHLLVFEAAGVGRENINVTFVATILRGRPAVHPDFLAMRRVVQIDRRATSVHPTKIAAIVNAKHLDIPFGASFGRKDIFHAVGRHATKVAVTAADHLLVDRVQQRRSVFGVNVHTFGAEYPKGVPDIDRGSFVEGVRWVFKAPAERRAQAGEGEANEKG